MIILEGIVYGGGGAKIEIQNVWEELEIANDFLFGKVMRDAELCEGLLQRIAGRKSKDIALLMRNQENTEKEKNYGAVSAY